MSEVGKLIIAGLEEAVETKGNLRVCNANERPSTQQMIECARHCCGDLDGDCVEHCVIRCENRNGDVRWCREWLIHDLADRLEELEKENAELKGVKKE